MIYKNHLLIITAILFMYLIFRSSSKEIENFDSYEEDDEITYHDNHIYFYADVSRKNIMTLVSCLRIVSQDLLTTSQKTNHKSAPIYLHINSHGGDLFASTAAVDHILQCPVDVYTIVEGAVASAATLMSIVGKKRYIRPHSHMLIHQLSSSFSGKANEMKDEMKNINRLMDVMKKLYNEYTLVPDDELSQILKRDLWWNAEECIKHNLADEILKKNI